jgi:hypothetical protein
MTGRPRRTRPDRRAAVPAARYRAPRRPALPAGQLRALVLAHLQAHPGLDFTPAELANVLGRSRGAVINACQRLVALGLAARTRQQPQRYQAAAPPADGTQPDPG